MKEETDVLSLEDQAKKEEWKSEMEKLAHLDEVNWCQKLRAPWLKEGKNNTQFFHQLANSHRWTNCHWKLRSRCGNKFYGKRGEKMVGFYKTFIFKTSWMETLGRGIKVSINWRRDCDVAQGCKGNVGRDLEKKSITNPKLHHLEFAEHHHQVLENFLKHFHSSNQHS